MPKTNLGADEFYKSGQRKMLFVLLISMLLNVVLVVFLVYFLTNQTLPEYFSTSVNGRATPLYPLSEPKQSDSAILQWANQAAIAAFTYSFVNYKNELNTASAFFTPSGWEEFTSAMRESNSLDEVTSKKLIVSAVVTRAPVILQKGVLNGSFSWRVQMPMLITYQSASDVQKQNVVVTMLITRISTLSSPQGIGVSQMIVSPSLGE